MKEIGELNTKITFLLDEINVLGTQQQVAMALQQFHQVDLLLYEKKEKEVSLIYIRLMSEYSGQIMILLAHNRNYRCVMFVVRICRG
jgi:hypothetical protein